MNNPKHTTEGKYCKHLLNYTRRETVSVKIGDLYLGSAHPIRVQSMTTTDTMDTAGSLVQIKRMVDAGCELVRLTAPSINEAYNLENIRNEMKKQGIHVPLVADIHFTPNAAEVAARIVEKVRVNPGNYADKKKFETIEYTDATYAEELDRIREKFVPLVKICKEYGTAIRIGTNHGSLSDRIMSRYGDSPLGMVESAMEFLRICEDEGFNQIVLSMKSSNPQVMVEAYRLLVQTMDQNGMKYPLHLGVTEAGDGNDGRIKSALGIGALLEDGIGDTIRVSLTEDPEFEIPVAKKLVDRYNNRSGHQPIPYAVDEQTLLAAISPFSFIRKTSKEVLQFGGTQVPRVVADLSKSTAILPETLKPVGYTYHPITDKWHMSDTGCDFIYTGTNLPDFMLPTGLKGICDWNVWQATKDKTQYFPAFSASSFISSKVFSSSMNFLFAGTNELNDEVLQQIKSVTGLILILENSSAHGVADLQNAMTRLKASGIDIPIVLHKTYLGDDPESMMLNASTDCGTPLINGFGQGIMISAQNCSQALVNDVSFGILQAARARITKTEYISCPSCGRTLFDLQETTALIRNQTDHLKGVKIAIMGCIVNGPGEMADADYGYVGSGPGKITLYRGKEVVKKGVNKETAVKELIELIMEDGNWSEPAVIS